MNDAKRPSATAPVTYERKRNWSGVVTGLVVVGAGALQWYLAATHAGWWDLLLVSGFLCIAFGIIGIPGCVEKVERDENGKRVPRSKLASTRVEKAPDRRITWNDDDD